MSDDVRAAMLEQLAKEALAKRHDCLLLHVLHIACGVVGIGCTSAELEEAMRELEAKGT